VKPKRSSIFYELLDPELNTDKDLPSTELMADEAFDFLTAASDTAGNAMTVATHHVITNPQIYEQVKRELHDRFPDPNAKLDFAELEKLPFLTAVIKEGLRQAHSVRRARTTGGVSN
jgi:cytochrome P450